MTHFPRNFLLIFSLLITSVVGAQNFKSGTTDLNTSKNQTAKYLDAVYLSNIHTVRLSRLGQEMAMPVITIRSNEQLQLSFDDLDGNVKKYNYTIVHCNANWISSELWPSDYISGFTEGYVNDYRLSFNTIQPYVHYTLVFPSENLRLNLPGNYVLIVYTGNDPGQAVLTRRFMVLDQKVNIQGRIRIPTSGAERLKKHQISFTIETASYLITDPIRNLRVVVLQNGRWDNALTLQPMMIRGTQLDYQYVDETNVFFATNEFRVLDIRSVKYLVGSVSEINRDEQGYNVFLWPDKRRNFKPYNYEKDLNGRYFVQTNDGNNPDIEAEYVKVHFTLEAETAIPGADVYITGMLSDWQFSDENRMRYSSRRSAYEKSMLLKQGVYNYHYTLLNQGESAGNSGFFEGNHSDTGNEYTILVYYRQPGARYDNLIAIKTINSKDSL